MMRSDYRRVGPGLAAWMLVLAISTAPAAADGTRQDAAARGDSQAAVGTAPAEPTDQDELEPGGSEESEDSKRPSLVFQLSTALTTVGAPIRALVRIAPDENNRLLRLMVDSGDYYQSSDVQLDGADAARSHFLPLEGLPEGRYVLLAVLYGTDGERARARQNLRLVSTLRED